MKRAKRLVGLAALPLLALHGGLAAGESAPSQLQD